ncbi:MAG: DUF11 domain-containing protein, partial [Chloroflexi bacterium]|nr:DUF11 domain-containing protein [Chloroflexota bacterium]
AAIVCTTNFGTGTLDGTITDNGTSLTFDGSPAGGWDIPAGGYIECVYIVRVTSAVFANGSYTNTIDADWTSVNGSVPGERVYDDTPGVAVDGTQDTATATFSVPAPTFTKSDNGAALVNIGSTITYTLTVNSPLGTIRDLTITDVLPAGLIYNNDAVLNGMSAATTTVSAPNDGTANVTVTWAFGNALISGSPATITFTATVADVPANIPALVLTNNAALDYSDAAGIPQPQITGSDSVTIAGAPIITTTKAANPTTGVQAGDVVTYTVRFTNTGDSTAFDVTADDLLPTGVDYVGPAAIVCTTNFGTGTLDGTITDNGAALSFDGSPAGGWDIPATDPTDSYIECVYSVTATSSLFISGTFTNTIDADWSSQNGNVPNERLYTDPGDGTTVDTASASFTSPAPTFSKSDNGTTQAPIGGTITYTLTVNSSLGTLRGFSVSDVLPAGLIYNNDAVIVGVSSVAPTVSAPNDGTANVTITWNFGDAVITARPLTITFTATVANVPANVGGLLLTNTAALDYSDAAGTPQPQITGSDSFTIAGSEITTTKNVNPTTSVQAGDAVTYTVRFTNTGGSTAYEVTADDLLPPGTDYTGAAAIVCTTNFGVGTLDGTITDSGAALSFDGSPAGSWDIPAGGYIECVYSVVATSALALDGTHTNTIDADWTSLNGVIPGERTYTDPSDGTIMDTASASFSSAAPTFSKSDGGAGALPNVTIGGMLTYTLTISSPLGTLRNLAISDTLPAGLAYGGSFNVSAGIAPAPTFTQVGNMLTWTFGDAVISSASVTITYTAVVENVAGSQNGVTRSNSATLSYNNNAGTQTRTASDALTVVEPVLTIGKSILVPPAPPSAGGVVTYQVTLAHAANSVGTAFDLVLTDTLPAGLVNLSAVNITATGIAPPSFEVAGATLRLPSSADGTFDLPAGATVTITFQATIDSSAVPGAVLNNTADVIWSSLDGSAANERSDGVGTPDGADLLNSGALNDYEVNASASFTVGSYGIQKALDSTSLADTAGATVAIGEIVTYALTLTLPEGTIPSLTLVDQLPAGMAFVSGSVTVDSSGFGGSIPNAPIIASLGSSGDDVTLTFTNISVTADGNAANNSFVVRLQARVLNETGSSSGVVLGNSATLQPGSGPISASGTVNVTVGEPNLTIVKTFVPNVGGAGDVIQIQLLVNNIGTAPAYDLNIQDTLDARFSSITAVTTPGGFTFNLAGNTVTYTGGPVLVNTPLTFTFSVVLTNAVNANDVIPNTAVVNMYSSLPGTDANERTYPAVSDGDQLTVIGPDLSITKDDGGVSYTPGLPLIYTIVVSNTRGSNIAHAVVFDDLTSGGRYTSISWNCTAVAPTGGGVCHAPTSGTGDISTTVDLPLGASVTFVVNVTVNPAATGSLINTARVDTPAGVTDPDPLDNSAADTNSNNPIVNLSITKDDGTAAYTPGTSVTYTMIVRNSGPSDAINATVIDNLPPALLNAAWTCVASGAATCTPSGTGSINDTVTIAAGAANFLTYTLTANVDPAATGNLDNTVTVNVPPNFTDSAPQDNRATDSNSNDPRVDLRVTKDDGIIIYTPGTAQTYTIVVSNAGPSSVIGATVVDDLTTGGRYSSIAWDCTTVAATGGAACGASGTADINLAVDLPAGSTITFTVNVTVDSAFTGNLPNTVTITAPGGVTETDTNNNTATDTDGQIAADLAITKSNNTNIFRPGDTLVYTIIVSNNGPANVVGGLVTDTIPTLLDNPIWTCTASGAALCAANGTGDINDTVSLDVGETLTYTVTATVNQNAPVGQVSNTATIAPPVIMLDPDMTNNSATDTDNFGLFEPPQGFKTFDANRLPELTWSMYWVNNGNDPNTTLPIQIIDPIPQGTTYIDNSLVCAPEGQSTVTSCVFDQPNNRIVVTGTLYADPGVFNEQDAQHEILISYRTTVNGGVRQVDNIAALNWDANASGDVSDELAIPQMPVEARARWGDAALGAGAPVGLVKNVFPPFASPGDTVAWTILLTNPSSAPMANVVISDVLPDGLEPLSVTATAGTATLNGQTVNFTLGVLGANETVTLTVQTRISADYDGDPFLINRAVMNNGLSAEARLIVVDTLPATGETPSWRAWMLAGLWALSLMLGWRLARRL